MFLEENLAVPCSVSQEFVEFIAAKDEDNLMRNGLPILDKILFILGFDVRLSKEQEDRSKVGHGVITLRNVMIRNPSIPSQVYKTTVYNGQVRNEIASVIAGNITYKKNTPHYMQSLYMKTEILTPENLTGDIMSCITSIGDKRWYDEGMKAMDKRVDSIKKQRNIVR